MNHIITSRGNSLVKQFKLLHRVRRRREAGLTIAEGPTVFGLVAAAGVVPEVIFALESDTETARICDQHGWVLTLVTPEILKTAADTVQPRSPVAIVSVPSSVPMRFRDTLIISDVSDPGNVGTMIRSAAAFGWDVCTTGATADPWSPKVLRAGAGSHFGAHLSASPDPIFGAHELGLEVVATVASGGDSPERGETRIALLIGSEAHGLSPRDRERSDRLLTLSMPGKTESLNAAVAASIAMYALAP